MEESFGQQLGVGTETVKGVVERNEEKYGEEHEDEKRISLSGSVIPVTIYVAVLNYTPLRHYRYISKEAISILHVFMVG